MNFIQIITALPTRAQAKGLARLLVEKKLAGCVQVLGPIESVYCWKGKIEKAREYLCVIKTRKSLYKKAEKQIIDFHPYEVPEILATPVSAGNSTYLSWLRKETRVS